MSGASANPYLIEQEYEEVDTVAEISSPHYREQDQANLSSVSPRTNIPNGDHLVNDCIETPANEVPVSSQGDGGTDFAYTRCVAYYPVSHVTRREEGYDN